MILDEFNEFADAATLVASTGADTIVGDVIDLGAEVNRDIGVGEPLYLVLQVATTVAASGGAANATFKLKSDSTTNLATSATTHFTTAAIAKGTLVAGYTIAIIALPQGVAYERYLGVTVTPDTNNLTAGALNAFLTKDPSAYTAYPDATN